MKRTALAFGAALALLGGCAPYATSGAYYGGGGYYEPDYYGPTVYAQPYGGYGGGYGRGYRGGYGREHRDGDHAYRGQDRDHGDRQNNYQGNRQDTRQDNNR